MKNLGLFVASVLVVGIFSMGMSIDEAFAPKKPKEIVVVGSKVVDASGNPVSKVKCSISAIGAQESKQVGNDRTNKIGKVNLVVIYEDPDDVVTDLQIICEKDGQRGEITVEANKSGPPRFADIVLKRGTTS